MRTHSRHFAALLFVVTLAVSWLPALCGAQGIEITHLGNEGFLLTAGEQKVLVDALFGDGLRGYPVVPEAMRRQVEAAEGPYAGVDLVLASHFHDDHFDPAAVARHLGANPGALFVSTEQAAKEVLAQGVAAERVKGFWPEPAERHQVEHGGVALTIVQLHHGGSSAQNLGLLVELGGVKVLHMGDTAIRAEELEPYALDKAGIDVALVPYWRLDSKSSASLLEQLGNPQLVAMHFPSTDAPARYFGQHRTLEGQVKACRGAWPEAWMALESGEARSFSAR